MALQKISMQSAGVARPLAAREKRIPVCEGDDNQYFVEVECECTRNPEHGKYMGRQYFFKGIHIERRDCMECPKCLEERKAKSAGKEKAAHQDEIEEEILRAARARALAEKQRARKEFYNRSNVGELYQGVLFADIEETDDTVRAAKKAAKQFVENYPAMRAHGVGLCFFGAVGTGKTMMATAVLSEMFEKYGRQYSCFYTEIWSIFRMEKISWTTKNEEYLDRLKAVDLLVIDEIGVQHSSAFETVLLMEILNARKNNNRTTLFISNFNPVNVDRNNPEEKTIKGSVGEQVFERVKGNTLFLKFAGKSHRRALKGLDQFIGKAKGETE